MIDSNDIHNWKGPTIREISNLAGVSLATVDRVLNNRPNVTVKTRKKVKEAVVKLNSDRNASATTLDIRLFSESGESFNTTIAAAVTAINRSMPGIQVTESYEKTNSLDVHDFAERILNEGLRSDGVVVIAHEHPVFNNAIRKLESKSVPVVCLTTDLPSSRRSAYVGNDQYASGSVAGHLIGNALPKDKNKILLVMSLAFRCQQEREMGFRRVLRADFPHLKIEDRLTSDDRPETTYEHIKSYIAAHGTPAAIYNLAGANRGIAMALEETGCSSDVVFVGHELTSQSKTLLEKRAMDYVISHDSTAELTAATKWIAEKRQGLVTTPWTSPILVHTRYNCDL